MSQRKETKKMLQVQLQEEQKKVEKLKEKVKSKSSILKKVSEENVRLFKANDQLHTNLTNTMHENNELKNKFKIAQEGSAHAAEVEKLERNKLKDIYEIKLSEKQQQLDICNLRNEDLNNAKKTTDNMIIEKMRENNLLKMQLYEVKKESKGYKNNRDDAVAALGKSQYLHAKDIKQHRKFMKNCTCNERGRYYVNK